MRISYGAYWAAAIIAAAGASAAAGAEGRRLWFDQPAQAFTESCVLGNGRLGAMLFGGVQAERVVLNEEGMWSGSPQDADRRDAAAALPEIRRRLLAGENYEAEQLVNQHFTCAGVGSNGGRGKSVPYGCYQTLGELRLQMTAAPEQWTDYRRELHLSNALATVSYKAAGVRYTRSAFVSHPDEAFVLHLQADTPGAISFDAWLERPERADTSPAGRDTLIMRGQLEDGRQGDAGVRFAACVRVIPVGGQLAQSGQKLTVRNADSALVVVTAATDIDSFAGRTVEDAPATAARDIEEATARPLAELEQRHIADHRGYYDRLTLTLGDSVEAATATTPQRIASRDPEDHELVALLFDYGRYLLIGSSRPGGLPANLQGIWAEELQTPWNADWHANVNVQMNYWPAGPCNLIECERPLVRLIESLEQPGRRTAHNYYKADGWVAHLLLNPWGFTSPGESASWGSTPTCSAWLCQHLWDHYLYTQDAEYLERIYPVLRGASEFYADMLIEEPTHGWLVTAPSNSPENAFIDDQGRTVHTCMGPACDQQLLRFLFDATLQSAQLLGRDQDYAAQLRGVRDRLAPTRIGDDGRVMEWLTERNEQNPHHRHLSHLWGLYPAFEITLRETPELARAARRSLEVRGDGGTGWSIANKACLWARLGNGDRALSLLQRLIKPVERRTQDSLWRGGLYPNLLDAHPPFQIDGNFGATAAVAEMLLQSRHDNPAAGDPPVIELLPAVPSRWPDGKVTGLAARGGATVSMQWRAGRLVTAEITPRVDGPIAVRYAKRTATIDGRAGTPVVLNDMLAEGEGPQP